MRARICFVAAVLCLLAAGGWFGVLVSEDSAAREGVEQVVRSWDTGTVTEQEKEPDFGEESILEENSVMRESVVQVEACSYLGMLTIPSLDLTLPIQASWDFYEARHTPCRYLGSVMEERLILAGHNYRHHFGRIGELKPGDEMVFTDANGISYQYTVSRLEVLSDSDVDGLLAGTEPLTLFTCTLLGNERIVVRCDYQN